MVDTGVVSSGADGGAVEGASSITDRAFRSPSSFRGQLRAIDQLEERLDGHHKNTVSNHDAGEALQYLHGLKGHDHSDFQPKHVRKFIVHANAAATQLAGNFDSQLASRVALAPVIVTAFRNHDADRFEVSVGRIEVPFKDGGVSQPLVFAYVERHSGRSFPHKRIQVARQRDIPADADVRRPLNDIAPAISVVLSDRVGRVFGPRLTTESVESWLRLREKLSLDV